MPRFEIHLIKKVARCLSLKEWRIFSYLTPKRNPLQKKPSPRLRPAMRNSVSLGPQRSRNSAWRTFEDSYPLQPSSFGPHFQNKGRRSTEEECNLRTRDNRVHCSRRLEVQRPWRWSRSRTDDTRVLQRFFRLEFP